jgi:hypothetical protein
VTIDVLQAMWKNSQSAAAGTEESQLPVYNLPSGQIIVPGLAGGSRSTERAPITLCS